MRAALFGGDGFSIAELDDPQPAFGQILVAPFFSGICGSDLHVAEAMRGDAASGQNGQKLVFGHEFSAEVLEIGPGTKTRFRPGDRVVGLPFMKTAHGHEIIGFSPTIPGGFSSRSIMLADRSFRVPEDVPSDLAALTEPLAVGMHAANLANRNRGPNVIIGGGPVGMAVLLALQAQGRGPNLVSEFSADRRRIAESLGADIVVDPAQSSPYASWEALGFSEAARSPLLEPEMRRQPHGVNIFDCVGAKGLIDQIIGNAPVHSHIIVVGACSHQDHFTPVDGIKSELTIEFSGAYRLDEFEASLKLIADMPESVNRLITSRRPLAEIAQAFEALTRSPDELKILIDPRS